MKKQVGERVRAYRRDKGLKQAELAALVNTRQAHISNIERGIIDLPLSMIERLADALGIDAIRLLRDEVTG